MSDNIKSDLGERLKHLRITNNCTQKEIAEYLNITLRAYQYYEVGERFPSIETIIALSKKYKIPFLEVLFDKAPLERITLTFKGEEETALSKALSEKANNFGLSSNEIISYILLSHTFNN